MSTTVYDQNGRPMEVTDEAAARLVQAGTHTLDPKAAITVRNAMGGRTSVTSERLAEDPSLTPYSSEEEAQLLHQQNLEREHDTLGSKAKAFAHGFIKESTPFFKPFEEDAGYHSGWNTAGSIAAMLPQMLTGGGEAELGAKALETGVKAAEVGEEGLTAGRALSKLGRLYDYTVPGISGRVSRAAEALIPGTSAGARIARTAVGGAAWAGTDELLNQALDPDKEFSGEQLLHAGLWGGAIGAAGGGLSEASGLVGKLGKGGVKEFDELAALQRTRPTGEPSLFEPRQDWETRIPSRIGDVKVRDGIVDLTTDIGRLTKLGDEALENTAVRSSTGLSKFELEPLVADAKRASESLQTMMVRPDAPIGRLAADLRSADTLAQRLSSMTDELPKRWSDPTIRSEFYKDLESRLAKLPTDVDPHVVAAERLSAYLGTGLDGAEKAAVEGGIKGFIGRKLIGSKLGEMSKYGFLGGGAVYLAEHLADGAAGMLVKGGLVLGAAKTLGPMALKAVGAAFRDPAIGAAIAGSAAHLLNSSNVPTGKPTPSHVDPRAALRDFATRTRSVTPQQVAAATTEALGHMAGAAPLSTAAAADTAARRHAYILRQLDLEDPPADGPLGRPLPSAASTRRIADAVRATASPNAFIVAALSGRLTPQMLAAAEAVFPATVQRLRTALLSQLAAVKDPTRLPPETRRIITMLLGQAAGGGTTDQAAYRSAMDASVARASQGFEPTAVKNPPAPPGPVSENNLASPAQRASHPAGGH